MEVFVAAGMIAIAMGIWTAVLSDRVAAATGFLLLVSVILVSIALVILLAR